MKRAAVLVRRSSGDVITTVEYDAHGNWIGKTWFLQKSGDLKAYRAEYRTIVYY